MITYRQILSDVIEMLNQHYDDNAIQPSNVLYWISIISNKLRAQHITKRIEKGTVGGENIKIFQDIPIEVSPVSNGIVAKGRKFIRLPISVLNLERDDGIEYISPYHSDEAVLPQPGYTFGKFQRTTAGKAARLYMHEFEKPAPDNSYFYRVGDILYLLGIEKILLPSVEVGLIFNVDYSTIESLDDKIPLPDHLGAVLAYEVYNLGFYALKIPGNEMNDGTFKAAGNMDVKDFKQNASQ